MKKKEASQHSKLEAWIRYFIKTEKRNVKVELKHARERISFPFSEVKKHQIDDLIAFENFEPFVWKFDDTGYREKPVDFIGTTGGSAFIAVRFSKIITIISINVWINEKGKSITAKRAQEIAYDWILI